MTFIHFFYDSSAWNKALPDTREAFLYLELLPNLLRSTRNPQRDKSGVEEDFRFQSFHHRRVPSNGNGAARVSVDECFTVAVMVRKRVLTGCTTNSSESSSGLSSQPHGRERLGERNGASPREKHSQSEPGSRRPFALTVSPSGTSGVSRFLGGSPTNWEGVFGRRSHKR